MNPEAVNNKARRPALVPRSMTELELHNATDTALRHNQQLLCNACYINIMRIKHHKMLPRMEARPIEEGTEFFNNLMRWSSMQAINPRCCMCGDVRETERRVVIMTP